MTMKVFFAAALGTQCYTCPAPLVQNQWKKGLWLQKQQVFPFNSGKRRASIYSLTLQGKSSALLHHGTPKKSE